MDSNFKNRGFANKESGNRDFAEERKQEIDSLINFAREGVDRLFNTNDFRNFFSFAAKFGMSKYSINNLLLIMNQCPQASFLNGYKAWQSVGRQVKKGEKGIRILAPVMVKRMVDQEMRDSLGNPIYDFDGNVKTMKVEREFLHFRPISVFDVSQTKGEPIPEITVPVVDGVVHNYDNVLGALASLSPYPVYFHDASTPDMYIDTGAKGYCDYNEKKIVLSSTLNQVETIGTLLHEIAHARLHADQRAYKSREEKEMEAECMAFMACSHIGIDVSEFAIYYIATWGAEKDINERTQILNDLKQAGTEYITDIDYVLQSLELQRTDPSNEWEIEQSQQDSYPTNYWENQQNGFERY